ncbi:phospholipid scramblase 2 [Solenopsis invicta]|uniref:phospholipid scramblase 2 n=1 Tax=Solenopsis invicta TaxID=13686 RepID=UPI00193D65F7|nr:phospholipid scramblase 2 [Solenopsis invicta]
MCDQRYQALYSPLLRLRIQPPIVTAPQANALGWSQTNMTYPPGLVPLMGRDHLFMKQKTDLFHVSTGKRNKNKYVITDNKGKLVYYIAEESETVPRLFREHRCCCEFYLYDKNQKDVLRMSRHFRSTGCFTYEQELKVYSGNTPLGSVTKEWTYLQPQFCVRDALGKPVLMMKGSFLNCDNAFFKVMSMDEKHHVGAIQKKPGGFREIFSDIFCINFPLDLDAKIKAVLLGGAVLIDFTYVESSEDEY